MPAAPTYPASELFHLWRAGDQGALNRFLPLVYDELRRVARRHLRRERADHTLQTTALIHEAYLRLVRQQPTQVQDRCHFVALTSNLMRQILVDHARERLAKKRDGGCRITLAADAHRDGSQRRRDRAEGCRQLGSALTTYRALSATMSEAARDVRQSTPKLEACRQYGTS